MTSCGTVLRLHHDGTASVRVPRESACGGSCAACGGCAGRAVEIRAHNRAGARAGDRVEITSSTRKTLWLCFVAYLMPVVLFIAGWLAHPAVGIALLCLSAGAAFMVNRRLRAAGGLRTEISRVVGGS